MPKIIQTRIAHTAVNLPSENVPVNTRAALDRIGQWQADRSAAARERDATHRAAQNAASAASSSKVASYLNTGKIDRSNAVEVAKAAAEQAQADLNTIIAAEWPLATQLHQAVSADEKAWTVSAYADAKKALTKLVTAARMAQEAADTLYPTIGVLGMYRQREEGARPLSVVHVRGSFTFDLNAGIEGIRESIAKATHELEALKPGTKRAEPELTQGPTVDGDDDD